MKRFFLLFVLIGFYSCAPEEEEKIAETSDTTGEENFIDTFSVKRKINLSDSEKAELARDKREADSIIAGAAFIITGGQIDTSGNKLESKAIVANPDVYASFPGGESAMQAFIKKKLIYPLVAFQNDVKGTVTVKAIVESDGRIGGITVARGLGYGCDEAAIDCVRSMPNWKPGQKNGVNVRTQVTIPIRFGDEIEK
jgi:TonB family protein